MASTSTKIGHGLAKVLGIKLNYRNELDIPNTTRGESTYSSDTHDTYVEEEPRSIDWVKQHVPTPKILLRYLYNLFPFVHWIGRYNVQWLIGDLVAGITVGAVVVPQSMAYATLATLKPEIGLYSSFMGVLIYWFFATSKDITIGPVAVVSTIVGHTLDDIAKDNPDINREQVASALALIAGSIILFIGLVRCGWIVDFISLTAISVYMTGSAINIAVGQVPNLMGIKGFDSRASTYRVVINILSHLGRTKLDAAMGLTALTMLYLIRFACNYSAKKVPHRSKTFFFIATLRTAFVILLYTMISWLVNRHHRKKPLFKILGKVPRGFKDAGAPKVDKATIKLFASQLPATVIVLLIEHIAIAKSFGRVNNYVIDPSQEMVAIGITNILGPFLGAYPATGSFSRTAIKSKAGVRTPFAGVITALVVLLAIYALPAVFFYIPQSSLAAIIIHAVLDLITPPNVLYQFWRVSPLEVPIFLIGVFVIIFSSIENGIYTVICISIAKFLFRVIKARGRFLGRAKVHSVLGDHILDGDQKDGSFGHPGVDGAVRNVYLPIDHHDGSNPEIEVDSPYPGIFIYRFSEGFNYPNANHYIDYLTHYVFKHTRRTNKFQYARLGDRPWNDPGPRRGKVEESRDHLPTLKAIILDFSSVNNVDATSVQILIDVRNQLDRWAAPGKVEWHFANITNRWTKRALVSAGFGYPTPDSPDLKRWKPIFSVAEIGGSLSAAAVSERRENEKIHRQREPADDAKAHDGRATTDHIGSARDSSSGASHDIDTKGATTSTAFGKRKLAPVQGLNRPFFHIDITNALNSAIADVEARGDEFDDDVRKDTGVEP